uniref:Protein AMN1 homolog n=1 Tax=Heterorhabditis bacteriophora TaxID=37862 RepID=A0A1I7XR22_HETBA
MYSSIHNATIFSRHKAAKLSDKQCPGWQENTIDIVLLSKRELVLTLIVHSNIINCLDDCLCDRTEEDAVIRCEHGDRKEFSIPTNEMSGYKYIAFTCNDLRSLPSVNLLKAAFPDLQGIDIQGNVNFDCSSLKAFESKVAILSDCDADTKPIKCDESSEVCLYCYGLTCDWKCKTLDKLREMWKKFKMALNRKIKDWGAEETVNDISNWFTTTYRNIASSLQP